jgi:hypothetical protein
MFAHTERSTNSDEHEYISAMNTLIKECMNRLEDAPVMPIHTQEQSDKCKRVAFVVYTDPFRGDIQYTISRLESRLTGQCIDPKNGVFISGLALDRENVLFEDIQIPAEIDDTHDSIRLSYSARAILDLALRIHNGRLVEF